MMSMLGRIPVETQIAPKREKWKLFPHRRGVDELGAWSPNECLFGTDCRPAPGGL